MSFIAPCGAAGWAETERLHAGGSSTSLRSPNELLTLSRKFYTVLLPVTLSCVLFCLALSNTFCSHPEMVFHFFFQGARDSRVSVLFLLVCSRLVCWIIKQPLVEPNDDKPRPENRKQKPIRMEETTPQTQRWIRVSTWWGPEKQHRSKEAFPDDSQHQHTGRRRDDLPYQHIDRVPDTTTRGRQRTSEAQNGSGFFYWQRKAYFKRKLGIINKIIKAKHHFNQMSKETSQFLLNKLPLILGNNNKPAMTSDDTHKEIWHNAKNCQKKTILTLEDHHK